MTQITFTVGPPGAGKTRWAQEEIAERGSHEVQRVNLDDWLTMIHGRGYGHVSGDDLKLAQRGLISTIRSIAATGRDVIADNTHLSTRFPNLVRDELGDEFEYRIKDFTGLSLPTLIEQDTHRRTANPPAYVGADEVTRLWNKAQALRHRFGGEGLPVWEEQLNRPDGIEPYKPDTALPKAVLVDIDGTLALARSRGPYDTSRYLTDELESRLATLINDLTTARAPYQIVILTGRYAEHRSTLEEWLETNHVRWDEIYMRPDGDSRRDNQVKLDLFNAHVRDRFNVIGAFDDRDRVVRLWRRLGLLTAQCAEGDF